MCTQVANDKRPMQAADEGDLNAPTMQEMQHLVYRLFIEAARRARQAAPVRPALTKAKKEAQDQHLLDVLRGPAGGTPPVSHPSVAHTSNRHV